MGGSCVRHITGNVRRYVTVQTTRKILVTGRGPRYRGAGRRSVLAHVAPLCDFGTCWYGHCRALPTQYAVITADPHPHGRSSSRELGEDLDDGGVREDHAGRRTAAGGRAVHQEGGRGEHFSQAVVLPAPGDDHVERLRQRPRLDGLQLHARGLPGRGPVLDCYLRHLGYPSLDGPGRCCPRVLVCFYTSNRVVEVPPSERLAADHERARAIRRGASRTGAPAAPGPRAPGGR